MMEDSDILTLGWGCDTGVLLGGAGNPGIWPPQGEEFVTLEVGPRMFSCSLGFVLKVQDKSARNVKILVYKWGFDLVYGAIKM